jgi:hypothetical protein
MGSGLEVVTPSLELFAGFLVMAGACLVLSLYFYRKSRALTEGSKSLTAGIFDRTFNVLSLISEHRQTHDSFLFFLFLSPMSAVMYAFIGVFVVLLPLLSMGLLLWPVVAILCLSLMMVEEAIDARETANTFERAFKKDSRFAAGDLRVLSILKKVTARLSTYYFALALLFIAFFTVMPYAFSTLLLAWTYFGNLFFGTLGTAAIPFAIIPTALIFALAMLILFVAGRKLKEMVFGFPPSGHLTSPFSAEVRRRLLTEKLHEAWAVYQEEPPDSNSEEETL